MADPQTKAGAASAAPAAPSRANLVQRPVPASAATLVDDAINGAEQLIKNIDQSVRNTLSASLPQSVLDEMEAGKAALARHAPTPTKAG